MSFLARLFRPRVELPPGYERRLDAWRALEALSERTALADVRFVVVDLESTGLDPRRDRLLAIGAFAIGGERLVPADSFGAFVRNAEQAGGEDINRENILVHGIGPEQQAAGEEPEAALMGFLEYAGKSPMLAFHAAFDRTLLDRCTRARLGVRLPNLFIDLACLAPALVPEARLPQASLDDWLAHFGLRAQTRHSAASDAFATAELALVLLARAREQGIETLGQLSARAEPFPRHGMGGMG
jgi:DNA polymerase-3 subunit epsilon